LSDRPRDTPAIQDQRLAAALASLKDALDRRPPRRTKPAPDIDAQGREFTAAGFAHPKD
jgi:hypothetical protein